MNCCATCLEFELPECTNAIVINEASLTTEVEHTLLITDKFGNRTKIKAISDVNGNISFDVASEKQHFNRFAGAFKAQLFKEEEMEAVMFGDVNCLSISFFNNNGEEEAIIAIA